MTTYVPGHAPGTCQACDWARSISPVWVEVPAPPDCSECVEMPGVHDVPRTPVVQAGLPKPGKLGPDTAAPLTHGGTVQLPAADTSGRHPAVTRPRSTRRPASS